MRSVSTQGCDQRTYHLGRLSVPDERCGLSGVEWQKGRVAMANTFGLHRMVEGGLQRERQGG